MSVRVSAVTPRVSRQPSRTWRLIGTLAASRGKNSTTLNSTSSTSRPGLAVVVRLATFPAWWLPNARPGPRPARGVSCQSAGGGEDKTVAGVSLRDEPVPHRYEPGLPAPPQIGLGVRMIPEHLRAQIRLGPGPPGRAHHGQQAPPGTQPGPDPLQQRSLVGQREVNE